MSFHREVALFLENVSDMENSKVRVFSLDPPSSRVGLLLGWVGINCMPRAERLSHLSWFSQLRKQHSFLLPLPKSIISKVASLDVAQGSSMAFVVMGLCPDSSEDE